MVDLLFTDPDVYRILVPLPGNPLKSLNSYLVKTAGHNLLIDTGFNRPDCLATLKEGLHELGVRMDETDIFLTHFHSDHSGLVEDIQAPGRAVYLGWKDHDTFATLFGKGYVKMETKYMAEGFPAELIDIMSKSQTGWRQGPRHVFEVCRVTDGDEIQVGPYAFECVFTPGHTPGHSCLYHKEKQLLFCGDHVLFNITPNITSWYGVEDSLRDYLQSLAKISSVPSAHVFPAHRGVTVPLAERAAQIGLHHMARLRETENAVAKNPGSTAYTIASLLTWSAHGRRFADFGVQQQWFATGEALAHLDYLAADGRVQKHALVPGEPYRYTL